MFEIFGKEYYFDVDAIIEKCRPTYPAQEKEETVIETVDDPETPSEPTNDSPPSGGLELNVFKFEVFKTCLERTLNEYEESDDKMGVFTELSPSFKIAFNTLLKYDIIREENND
jgi:hypothetical protein